MNRFKEYHDAHSRAVFMAFQEALGPLMERITPDWLLHHMEIRRLNGFDAVADQDRVEIRLVIKPIGSARLSDQDADLMTGHKRLAAPTQSTRT